MLPAPRTVVTYTKRRFLTLFAAAPSSQLLLLLLLLSTSVVVYALEDYDAFEMLMIKHDKQQSLDSSTYHHHEKEQRRIALGDKIRRQVEKQQQRQLQGTDTTDATCFMSTTDESSSESGKPNNNRYCVMDDTPHEDTFLLLACPTLLPQTENEEYDNFSGCACAIGIGEPEEAPNTETCSKCTFCRDSTLAYDCRNVAEGTCIGINCRGECVSSLLPEEPLEEDPNSGSSGSNSVVTMRWVVVILLVTFG